MQFWCYLSGNLEEAVEHLTMEIPLNLNSVAVCSWCYASGIDNGVVGWRNPNPDTLSGRFSQVIH
jgi:hypothetical protein